VVVKSNALALPIRPIEYGTESEERHPLVYEYLSEELRRIPDLTSHSAASSNDTHLYLCNRNIP
jgi:hypothetical protein